MKASIYLGMAFIMTSCALFNKDLYYQPKSPNEYFFASFSAAFRKATSDCMENEAFPCGFPQPNDSLSDFENKWYSKHLKSLKEPILYNQKNKGIETIRFTHLGTWSNPFSYRIENKNGKIKGTYNKSKGLGGYKAGRRIKHEQKILLQDDWKQIMAKMASVDFWNIQTHDSNMIADGAEWILEVLIDGKYHFVIRTSPAEYDGKEYAELCKLVTDVFEK